MFSVSEKRLKLTHTNSVLEQEGMGGYRRGKAKIRIMEVVEGGDERRSEGDVEGWWMGHQCSRQV